VLTVDEHPTGLADRRGPGAGAAPVRRADVERDADDADRRVRVARRNAKEARWNRERWRRRQQRALLKRNTATAMAQVQRPASSPVAVSEVVSMMRLLVS
jgi:hypothetical protein